jgi:hypothetical protein
MFLVDLLDNLPRLRMSQRQRHLQMVLWVMGESGAENVPSLYALRQIQQKLHKKCGVSTQRFESSVGNILYFNSIPDIIAKVVYIMQII